MNIIKKIKGLNEEKRRAVVFIILFFLAWPLLFLVFNNFKTRMDALNQAAKLKALQLPEITPEVSQSIDELEQAKENFDEQRQLMEIWGDFSATTIAPTTSATSVPEIF
jgi:hypothetical protein